MTRRERGRSPRRSPASCAAAFGAAPGSPWPTGTREEFDEGEPGRRGARRAGRPAGRGRALWLESTSRGSSAATSATFLRPARRRRPRARARAAARGRATSPSRCSAACSPARRRRTPASRSRPLYHSAVEHLEVGGDWHDAFRLAGGRSASWSATSSAAACARPARWASCAAPSARWRAPASSPPRCSDTRHLRRAGRRTARYATLVYAEVDPDTARGDVRLRRPPPAGHRRARRRTTRTCSWTAAPRRSASPPRPAGHAQPPAGRRLPALHRRPRRAPGRADRRGARAPARRHPRDVSAGSSSARSPSCSPEQGAPDDDVCLLSFRFRPRPSRSEQTGRHAREAR